MRLPLVIAFFLATILCSCEKEDSDSSIKKPPPVDNSDNSNNSSNNHSTDGGDVEDGVVSDKIKLFYSEDRGKSFPGEYEAVRVGEYYWMNNNFNHKKEHPVSRAQLNKILGIYGINPQDYAVSIDDFDQYYGQYYSREYIEFMFTYGRMYEGVKKKFAGGWSLPAKADFKQLFAMCGDGEEKAVRYFLTCRIGENPVSMLVPGSAWFSTLNLNIYGFNLLPGGGRFHVKDHWNPYNDSKGLDADQGDFYALLQAAVFPALDGTVKIHDYTDTTEGKVWQWLPMRWCRKLTDKELGYKLYINSAQTDIQKLNLGQTPPSGYTELPHGYIRGFYVQFILDNSHADKSVAEIVRMAKALN